MKNLLGSALLVLLLASSCGTKPAENTAASGTPATNQPAAADASKSPIFDTQPTTKSDALIFSEVLNLIDEVDRNVQNATAVISNNIEVKPFAGQQLDNVEGFLVAYTLKNGGKYITADMMLNKTKLRKVSLRNDKMEKCECSDIVADDSKQINVINANVTNSMFFYFSPTKNKWAVMKPDTNIPSVEVQKQMFEECLAQAEIIKEFAKTAKAPATK